MKKTYLLTIFLAAAMTTGGCSMAQIEKEPVVIADTLSSSIGVTEASDNNNGINTDQTASEPHTDIEPEDALNETVSEKAADHTDEAADTSEPIKLAEETKKLTIQIEGMEEEINGVVYHSDLGYQITYDKDRFKFTRPIENVDSFTADNPDPELYPYVFINIRRIKNNTKDNNHSSDLPQWALQNDVSQSFHITPDQMAEVPFGKYTALYYHSTSGEEWNSTVNNYYVVENGDYSYFIDTQYFLEAAEGYGARIDAMLKTLIFE